MTHVPDTQQLLETLRQTKAGMQRISQRLSEPLAIVGLGCRFPGANNPAEFWEMLREGRQVATTSGGRWSEELTATHEKQTGRITANRAGFLSEIDQFDTGFFGISGREAAMLDPQQRLLLEVAWETMEHASIDPTSCRGKRVGVFIGICSNDYLHRLVARPYETIDTYLSTGNAHGAAAGRLSYFMDWRGPSVAIDTACSSSLTALHMAARSLRYGDCEMAMVMGVNVILAPELSISLSQAGMLSPTGRCHSFSSDADGFARGEGCGAILLKRLSKATEDGDQILCVVRGTASGQDGRSNGLTAPNGQAQQQVIREALFDARLKPEEVDYVEAHGTGTPLGDPIEMDALREIFSAGRGCQDSFKSTVKPLLVGSTKANLGHLEGAAGIAGVIKVALSLAHEALPPQPDFDTPSPHIDWSWPVEIPATGQAWNRSDRPRIAGVSSFGFGGSNAHAILAEAPATRVNIAANTQIASPLLFVLSAKSPEALHCYARRIATELRGSKLSLADVCYTSMIGRSHFEHRLALRPSSMEMLANQLEQYEHSAAAKSTSLSESSRESSYDGFAKLASKYLKGETLDWHSFDLGNWFGTECRRVALPTYPFQRTRRWFDASAGHTLLGDRLDLAGDAMVFETDLSRFAYLADHRVHQAEVFPASGLLELAITAGKAVLGVLPAVSDLTILRPIVRHPGEPCKLQVRLDGGGATSRGEIFVRSSDGWQTAATFSLAEAREPLQEAPKFEPFSASKHVDIAAADHYDACSQLGLNYGPSFRGLTALYRPAELEWGQAWGRVNVSADCFNHGELLHPGLLDACLQVAAGSFDLKDRTWIPVSIGRHTVFASPKSSGELLVSTISAAEPGTDRRVIQVAIEDADGRIIASIENLTVTSFHARSPNESDVNDNLKAANDKSRRTELISIESADGMQDYLHGRVADIMGLTREEIPLDQPLAGLGLDSLMAFELRDELERKLGVMIPIELFLEDITLETFSQVVLEKMTIKTTHSSDPVAEQSTVNGWTEGEI